MVPERKSYRKSIGISTCLYKRTLDYVSSVSGSWLCWELLLQRERSNCCQLWLHRSIWLCGVWCCHWGTNNQSRVMKANMLLNRARTIIGREWEWPEKALWIYSATTRPVLTYGSLVWAPSMDKTLGNKLKQIQRKILLAISGELRSTPTDATEVILGLIPLDRCIMELAARSRIRTKPLVKDKWVGIDGG